MCIWNKKKWGPPKVAFASPEGSFGSTGDNNLRTPRYWREVPDEYRRLYHSCGVILVDRRRINSLI